ncbi:alpha/beta hydrolase fold-domain-containing protein [Lyophyllum atratum]|nr:alpha/beta hydrolase fold-domain-containing protein [Lyophyllum atratum]
MSERVPKQPFIHRLSQGSIPNTSRSTFPPSSTSHLLTRSNGILPSVAHPAVPGGSEPLEVAKTQDFALKHTKFRSFTPKGEAPDGGWPVFIFFHGGGWTLGTIASETSFSTNMSVGAKCVVLSVDYRLAPEHPYPAAVEDAIESLDWVVQNGKRELNIDTSRIAVGGSSSGGNLAAILALKAAERSPPIPLVFQLLVVPVTDNTASVDNLWAENQHTPWLGPDRMNWFKDNYLPNKEDWTKWDASPFFAPDDLVAKVPKAWIAVAELDILKEEGVVYGKKLQAQGVEVETKIYEGAPHPVMAMDGTWYTLFLWSNIDGSVSFPWCITMFRVGKQLVSDAAAALEKAFRGQ